MDKSISIKFAPNLIILIKNGAKTFTYRLGNKFDFLSVGDVINVADNDSKDFAEVTIVEKSKTIFKDIPLDRIGHEAYTSEEAKKALFEQYYGREVDPQEPVIVLGFKINRFF